MDVLVCMRTTLHTCSPEFPCSYLKWAQLQFLRSEQTLESDADVISELGESQMNLCVCPPGLSCLPLAMGWGCLLPAEE